MELKDMVVSFELAEKLKMLGILQNSLFSFFKYFDGTVIIDYSHFKDNVYNIQCSAYTAQELFEYLPSPIEINTNTYVVNDYKSYRNILKSEVDSYPYAALDIVFDGGYIIRYSYNGQVIAFNKTTDNLYVNLISIGETLANSLAQMIIEIYSNKLTLIHFNIQMFKN